MRYSMRASVPGVSRHGFLFVSITGVPLSRSGANEIFARLRRAAAGISATDGKTGTRTKANLLASASSRAIDGILIEAPDPVVEFTTVARWAVLADFVATHRITFSVLDQDFGAVSDNPRLWKEAPEGPSHSWYGRSGGFRLDWSADRRPGRSRTVADTRN